VNNCSVLIGLPAEKEYKMNNELYFDGSCWPNPGGEAKYGCVICIGERTHTLNKSLGKTPTMTNNIAEWEGLIAGLKECVLLKIKELAVYGDSMLVIMQAKGEWRCKAEHLKQYPIICGELIEKFDRIKFEWIDREQNYLADELSKL
jgi:ribonuclease HI